MDITFLFMCITVITIAAFDIWVIIKKRKYYSISAYVIRGSKKYPLVVLIFGILLGHLFWSMDTFDVLSKENVIKRCQEYINE